MDATDSRVSTARSARPRMATGSTSEGWATTASGSSCRTAASNCRSSMAVATTRACPVRSRKCMTSSVTSGASSARTTLATFSTSATLGPCPIRCRDARHFRRRLSGVAGSPPHRRSSGGAGPSSGSSARCCWPCSASCCSGPTPRTPRPLWRATAARRRTPRPLDRGRHDRSHAAHLPGVDVGRLPLGFPRARAHARRRVALGRRGRRHAMDDGLRMTRPEPSSTSPRRRSRSPSTRSA